MTNHPNRKKLYTVEQNREGFGVQKSIANLTRAEAVTAARQMGGRGKPEDMGDGEEVMQHRDSDVGIWIRLQH